MSKSVVKLSKNLTIIGAPGSGKGFYGRPLAKHFGVPLYTTSSILRQCRPDLDLSSGEMIDCHIISETLQKFFAERAKKKAGKFIQHYILDGFPRTKLQIELMEKIWHINHQVHFALQLDVPDFVCEAKMLGRRQCTRCGKHWCIADVQREGFHLPPQLPKKAEDLEVCEREKCNHERDWIRREDDIPEIVRKRLRAYRHDYEEPVIDFYRTQGRLLSFTPYLGEQDIPKMKWTVSDWLKKFE